MFGSIGVTELIIIFVVALVIIGPKRMPDLARTLGKSLRDFKRATSDFQDSMNLEPDIDLDDNSSFNDASITSSGEEEKHSNRIDPSPPPDTAPETTSAASSSKSTAPQKERVEGKASSGVSSPPGTRSPADEPPSERTEQA